MYHTHDFAILSTCASFILNLANVASLYYTDGIQDHSAFGYSCVLGLLPGLGCSLLLRAREHEFYFFDNLLRFDLLISYLPVICAVFI